MNKVNHAKTSAPPTKDGIIANLLLRSTQLQLVHHNAMMNLYVLLEAGNLDIGKRLEARAKLKGLMAQSTQLSMAIGKSLQEIYEHDQPAIVKSSAIPANGA